MSTTTYEAALLQDVLLYAPNCPEITAIQSIRRTVIEFCQDTLWWKYRGDPQDVVKGEVAYDIDTPTDTSPVVVTCVRFKTEMIPAVGYSARNMWSPQNLNKREGPPRAYVSYTPSQIELFPIPDNNEAGALEIEVALMPTRTSTGADTDLMNMWAEGLTHGALYRLYSIPNQPFTNLEAAKMRFGMYRAEVQQAKISANKALTTANLSVKPRTP